MFANRPHDLITAFLSVAIVLDLAFSPAECFHLIGHTPFMRSRVTGIHVAARSTVWKCSTDATARMHAHFQDVEKFHAIFKSRGWVHVPDFLDKNTCVQMLAEANNLLYSEVAFRSFEKHTVYQEEEDCDFEANHPRNVLQSSSKRIVDFDRLQPTSPLKKLYCEPFLLSFVQEIVSSDQQLFLSACPYK